MDQHEDVRVSIVMDKDLRRRFKIMAAQQDTTISDYVLEPALERLERDEAAHRERQYVEEDKDGE